MALVTVSADKHYLVNPHGGPFFAIGVNYSGYFDRAWKMWETGLYDPTLIARDFRKAQQSGFNTVRLFAHAALLEEIRRDKFDKLDQTLSIAQDHHLLVLLTLNDAHALNLERVGQLDAKIAARYRDVPTLCAYDLENEPVFYNLVAAVYPEAYRPPVHTGQLIDHYGERVGPAEALELQRQRRIPGHLDEETAYYYINALRIFLEYDAAVNTFVKQGQGTLIDFMLSDDSRPWYPLISVLDGTVEKWLQARLEPIRATGCRQLLTVGWNWLHFAGLPANRLLDFQAYHNYTPLSMHGFNTNIAHLEGLRRAFPHQPIIFGEFGWSNQSGTTSSGSRPVPAEYTALYEAATLAFLRANEFAGGFKWMLNDVASTDNPYEASFGVFSVGDQAKPVRNLVQRFSAEWLPVGQEGDFIHLREVETGLAYRFDLPPHITLGGQNYQDDNLSWQAENADHCFINIDHQQLLIDAQQAGRLSLAPWDLAPGWNRARETEVYRVFSQQHRTRQQTFAAGESVVLDVQPGAQYAVVMGVETPLYSPPGDTVEIQPQPGEHVVLFGDFENYLHAALKYLKRFIPDFTFVADQVAGRWPYVTVVASPEQISDEVLDNIRGLGAVLVERVAADTPAATETKLNEMAQQGRRFLTAVVPPQEEPPAQPEEPTPGPDGTGDTYVVQPGDTLSKIAQQIYGDYRLWRLIFEANQDKISDPGLIRVGMELRLPERG
ncbi:MAG: LysM peptidoglycan-binding domain-containing protein [Anaerolineae bacterium]|nr:LysM peptidoglycan-binding domain-containing protein [Anaerolineae bacterium]